MLTPPARTRSGGPVAPQAVIVAESAGLAVVGTGPKVGEAPLLGCVVPASLGLPLSSPVPPHLVALACGCGVLGCPTRDRKHSTSQPFEAEGWWVAGHAGHMHVAAGRGIRGARIVESFTHICTRTLVVKGGNQSAADLRTVPPDLSGLQG